MSRATRLAAGWAVALAVAILLNLALAAPITAPESTILAGATSPTPTISPRPTAEIAEEALPPFPHWPPPGSRAGSARPASFAPMPLQDAAALQAAADRARAETGLQTLTLGVAIDGKVAWAGASGLARDGRTRLDGESPFAIASITKTFTASLVLQLVDEGRLELDDSVAELLPELGIDPLITVEQLLGHTSGLADLLAPMREPMNADPERQWTGAEVVARLGNAWFSPGADYGYSNSNYVLLGLLVERVTGRPFGDELTRRLLRPLGLEQTGLLLEPDAPMLMTPSWASAFGTSGAMYSSAMDLLGWADALYGGRVLQPATLERMLAFSEDGYGLGTEAIVLGSRTGYGHSGLLRGFTSLLVHLPQERVSLVVIGTWQGFDPGGLLTDAGEDEPSILDLALEMAAS